MIKNYFLFFRGESLGDGVAAGRDMVAGSTSVSISASSAKRFFRVKSPFCSRGVQGPTGLLTFEHLGPGLEALGPTGLGGTGGLVVTSGGLGGWVLVGDLGGCVVGLWGVGEGEGAIPPEDGCMVLDPCPAP